MIDLRSHILHGFPCGPATFDESVAMAHAAVADGVTTIVATPTWEPEFANPPIPFDECNNRVRELEQALNGTLSIKLGFAVQYHENLFEVIKTHGSKLALGGNRHLLIALPSLSIPDSTEALWTRLTKLGFSILLAHPECNPAIRRDPTRLARWVASGVALQFDSQSVTGSHGRTLKRTCYEWFRNFGSDIVLASNSRSSESNSMSEAREEIAEKVGRHQAMKAIHSTPLDILNGGRSKQSSTDGSSRGIVGSILGVMPHFKSMRDIH